MPGKGSGAPLCAVDENGAVKQRPNGFGDLIVSDVYLREQFPPPGKVSARSGGVTADEQLKDRLAWTHGVQTEHSERTAKVENP